MTKFVISGDSNGKNDPLVEIIVNDEYRETSIKENTINGIWNEKLIFDTIQMDINNKSTWPIMLVKLKDKDFFTKDLLGYAYIWLNSTKCNVNSIENVNPQWHQLFLPKSNRPQGEILLTIYTFDQEHRDLVQLINPKPETTPYTCELNILGLRDLKPLSLIPVKKPFISFDLNSLNITGDKEDYLQPLKTDPKDCGPNPTLNTVIQFDVNLPIDMKYIPELQCEVFDHWLSGMLNPSLGVFTLDIRAIIEETSEKMKGDMESITQKLNEMDQAGELEKKEAPLLAAAPEDTGSNKLTKLRARKRKRKTSEDEEDEKKIESVGVIKIDPNRKHIGKRGKNYLKKLKKLEGKNEKMGKLRSGKNNAKLGKLRAGKRRNPDEEGSNKDDSLCLISTSNNEENAKKDDEINKEFIRHFKKRVANPTFSKEEWEKLKNKEDFFILLPIMIDYKPPGIKDDSVNSKKKYRIEDLSKKPSSDKYFPLGYIDKQEKELNDEGKLIDKDLSEPSKITMHYRRYFKSNLEDVHGLKMRSPFMKCFLKRDKDNDKDDETSLFTAITDPKNKIIKKYYQEETKIENEEEKNLLLKKKSSKVKSIKEQVFEKRFGSHLFGRRRNKNNIDRGYGAFKGLVLICKKSLLDEYNKLTEGYTAKDAISKEKLKNLESLVQLKRQILVKAPVVIRVYILELNDLANKDIGNGYSDPYIKIYLGGKLKFDEQKNYQDDKKNCKWYKHYDILNTFPGESTLKIEVWDYDPLFSDELIGSTSIDLEDRYFNHNWKDLKFKPIETRKIYHPDMENSQGYITLWVDIFEKKDSINMEPWNIKPEPQSTAELRLVIWETEDMEMADVEGTSDIFINAYLDQKETQSTDIHYRCQTGVASFNWRVVLPIQFPDGRRTLTLQAYDRDLFKSNDYLSGAELDLSRIINIVKELDIPVTFNKKYVEDPNLSPEEKNLYKNIEFLPKSEDENEGKFWIQCWKNNAKSGRILCSLEILPMWKANNIKVGLGRDEPNVAPYLPPPVGRISFTLNPFKMINQCVGPKFRSKIYKGCLICCLGIYLICLIPYVIMYLSGEVANPFNW